MKVMDMGTCRPSVLEPQQLRKTARKARELGYDAAKVTLQATDGAVVLMILSEDPAAAGHDPEHFIGSRPGRVRPAIMGAHEGDTSRP
jgi:hypothetical protein